jgi:hypothetical protein
LVLDFLFFEDLVLLISLLLLPSVGAVALLSPFSLLLPFSTGVVVVELFSPGVAAWLPPLLVAPAKTGDTCNDPNTSMLAMDKANLVDFMLMLLEDKDL